MRKILLYIQFFTLLFIFYPNLALSSDSITDYDAKDICLALERTDCDDNGFYSFIKELQKYQKKVNIYSYSAISVTQNTKTGKLTSEQLRDFEAFIKAKHPLPEDAFTNIDPNASFTIKLDEHGDIVDSFTPEELEERIFKAETLVDKSFEYIKVIERTMFKYENSLQINELQWLSTELQKIFLELQKKVDFEE